MNEIGVFYAAAAALVALVVAVLLLFLRRRSAGDGRAAPPRARLATWALVLGLSAMAFGLYLLRGDPGAVGGQRGQLSEQLLQGGLPEPGESAERIYAELQQHLARQPGDPRALVLKARLDMRAERHADAAAAYAQALAGRSKAANDPGVWVEYAEATGMAQGRTLAGEPQRLVQKALALDAHHPQALDLAGSAAWEMRDFAAAAMYWKRLLEQIPAGNPRHAELTLAIQRAEQRARLSLPSTP